MVVFAIHRYESPIGAYMSPQPENPSYLPPQPIPLGCSSIPALSTLLHALNLRWPSILHMVIYMFQRYSLISSHPCLLLHSPKVCSLYLCLFCCLACRVVIQSVQFSLSVMSDSLRPHESQHARPPCPSPTPGVHSNSCPSSQ